MGSRKAQNKGALGSDGTFCVLSVVGSIECICQTHRRFYCMEMEMRKKKAFQTMLESYILDLMIKCGFVATAMNMWTLKEGLSDSNWKFKDVCPLNA